MRRMISLASIALALLSMWASATGAAAAPEQRFTVCYVLGAQVEPAVRTDRGSHQPIYVTGAVPTALTQDDRDVGEAFARFIERTKSLPAGMHLTPRCWTGHSPAEALKLIKQPDSIVTPNTGFGLDCTPGECVMTNWTSMPASSAAVANTPPPAEKPCGAYGWKDPKKNCGNGAPPAPTSQPVAVAPVAPPHPATPARTAAMPNAAAQPAHAVVPVQQAKPAIAPVPQTPYAFCWGGLSGPTEIAYFGAPFAAPVKNVPVWSAAYKRVLHEKYQFAGVIHCGTLKSLAAAQERMQKEKDQMRAHWKIVETGWKYQ